MSKFMFEGERYSGDGSRLPLKKRLKKAVYNLKSGFGRNKDMEEITVRNIERAFK